MKKLTTLTISIISIIVILLAGGSYYMFGHGLLSKTPMLYGTDTPDGIVKGYLETMIPRNIEAVELSKKIMTDADITIPQVRLIAARMSDVQDFEIGQMKGWYVDWFRLPVPLFLYKRSMTAIESTGDVVAKTYLKDMIQHYTFDAAEAKKARMYIEAIQKNISSTDGQLTITNSHPGIDATLIFTGALEEKRLGDIEEMKDILKTLK
jgi:Domain of unknown function (DUF305)